MVVTNPFTITYGGQAVGGTSDVYLLHEPYVIERSFDALHLSFNVVVVATSYDADANGLQQLSDTLETAFRARDGTLVIDIDGTPWTYTFGTTFLNPVATITKSGDSEADRGFSRMYTCTVDGELPVDDNSVAAAAVTGLQEMAWNLEYTPSRQRVVTVTGSYTATSARKARANYEHANGATTEATTFLAALSGSATYELEEESAQTDRSDHNCTFSQRYVELLADQISSTRDASKVRDHTMTFTEVFDHPGDSEKDVHRLRRVAADYDCAIDIDQQTDLQAVFKSQIRPHLVGTFRLEFSPSVYCIENQQVQYNETSKRLSVSVTFLFQSNEGDETVLVESSLTTTENRTVDYTPIHDGDELAMYADVGFAQRMRTATRMSITVTDAGKAPFRLGPGSTGATGAGGSGTDAPRGGGSVFGGTAIHGPGPAVIGGVNPRSGAAGGGWTTITSSNKATQHYIGDPTEEQLPIVIVEETVVQQFHRGPGSGGGGLFPRWSFPATAPVGGTGG